MTFWKAYTESEVQRAIRFYELSPDGQYDKLAAEGLRMLLEIRLKDLSAMGKKPQ
jgi:hypothetical protein